MKAPSLKTSKNHLKLKRQLAIKHSVKAFVLLLKLNSRENHNIYEHLFHFSSINIQEAALHHSETPAGSLLLSRNTITESSVHLEIWCLMN